MSDNISNTADYWIKHLEMTPHPEEAISKEIFRSKNRVIRSTEGTELDACTSIYYLLESSDFSGFHRLKSDELWYFHKGSPLFIHIIKENGSYERIELSDSDSGHLQAVVESGSWFAAEIPSKSGFTLVSCAVAPGFEFAEFEMAERLSLLKKYPEHIQIINKWCKL
ncbi:cupin domain-containing protein [Chryseobacterium wanjuense]